jgi:type IV pilus assembly protein PilA
MIVVAIIGVLAALAIYGVRRYLQSAKTSEAKNSIGAITRGAIGAYERETTANQLLGEGTVSAAFSHDLCGPAVPVPAAPPLGTKYQPNSAPGVDFEAGNTQFGWKCLKFTMTNPIYYRYHYHALAVGTLTDTSGQTGTAAVRVPLGATQTDTSFTAAAGNFIAYAEGDLDADAIESFFSRTGTVNVTTRTIIPSTQVFISQEFE